MYKMGMVCGGLVPLINFMKMYWFFVKLVTEERTGLA
jgi:hypothetical protein